MPVSPPNMAQTPPKTAITRAVRNAPALRGSPGMWFVSKAIIPVIRQHTPENTIAAPAVRDASYNRPVITPRAYARFHPLATGLTDSIQLRELLPRRVPPQ